SVCTAYTTKNTCDAGSGGDPRCRWDDSLVACSNSAGCNANSACVPKYQPNDCQPCKRLLRTLDTLEGEPGSATRCSRYTPPGTNTGAGYCNSAFDCQWN